MKGVRSSGRLSLACVGALLAFAACEEEKPDVKGTGLGLAIVKNIVESNDGSVSAGREGGGFLIKIKLKIHRAQKERKRLSPKRKKRGRGGKINKAAPNILYIFGA